MILLRFLAVSLGIHYLLTAGLYHWRKQALETKVPVEVVIVNKRPSAGRKTVIQPDLRPSDPEPPREARFLSDRNRSVAKETMARTVGRTQNGNTEKTNLDLMPKFDTSQAEEDPEPKSPENGGLVSRPRKISFPHWSQAGADETLRSSSIDYVLPGMTASLNSSFNTAESAYSTFHIRFHEKIMNLLRRDFGSFVESLSIEEKNKIINRDVEYLAEVILDKDGNVDRVLVYQSTGLPRFDEFFDSSFHTARQFPHPTTDLLKEDGMVHIQWGVIARVYGRPIAQH